MTILQQNSILVNTKYDFYLLFFIVIFIDNMFSRFSFQKGFSFWAHDCRIRAEISTTRKGFKLMSREDYIKALIKSHGYTMKDFAKIINMPYTTLLSILNGSIGGAAMDNVLKICGALNIRIEELNNLAANDETEKPAAQKPACIDPQLLKLLQKLPVEKQVALKLLLADK